MQNVVAIILAGGQGKRMRSADIHKVCFPVAGEPAIVRTVRQLKQVGIRRFFVVVGQMAEHVIRTLTEAHPDVAFVYQSEARGTGHATACAAAVLRANGCRSSVLVTMGDKVIEPRVVRELLAVHRRGRAELTLATVPKEPGSSNGRVVFDRKGTFLGIVEAADIRRAASAGARLRVGPARLSAARIEAQSPSVNASLYLYRAQALYDSIDALSDRNAQGELYLTDTAAYLASRGRGVAVVPAKHPDDILGFNTPEELVRVEETLARRRAEREGRQPETTAPPPEVLEPAGRWLARFRARPPDLMRALHIRHGTEAEDIEDRIRLFTGALESFIERYGADRPVVLAQAPARVNLMGRHVDHRGGYVNVIAINRGMVIVAAPRPDDVIDLHNLDHAQFPHRSFRISDLLSATDWVDWVDFINSATVREALKQSGGDWGNYVRAAVLRMQHARPRQRLHGMDAVVAGNIPMNAGLSSSSALVVVSAEAVAALNGLDLEPRAFVDLCGEGEWFVGSRGGSADHAAIRSGLLGRVLRIGFFPFRIERDLAFPKGYLVALANSHVRASKSAGVRDQFNQRVSCYRVGELLLRSRVPFLKGLEHLRDLREDVLGVSTSEIYRALATLPLRASRAEIRRWLPDQAKALESIFESHRNVGAYRIRDVVLFGIAECRRSDRFAGLLEAGCMEEIGRMMRISHDGDRVSRWDGNTSSRFRAVATEAWLRRRMREAGDESATARAQAAFWRQPGGYGCSTPEIDRIVDLAQGVPGVLGAQVAGAGLGGCVMILARTGAENALRRTLAEGYYDPRGTAPEIHVCRPMGGSGILKPDG